MNDLPIPSWDELFFQDVYKYARKSKDPRTKIGAVIVKWGEKDPLSHGYNGFPRKVNDDVAARWERPEKYFWVCHAEENSILNCARTGRSTMGAIMFTQGIPCADCAKKIIQVDIREVVVHKQWQDLEKEFNWTKFQESAERSKQMFNEAGVSIRVFDKVLGEKGKLDGKIITI
jgi:dCMP deaminase